MKTTKGKLRNITTGILHTNIGDVYIFLEEYLNEKGIMTHQLPSACRALQPILKRKLNKTWFDELWVKDGLDAIVEIDNITDEEKTEFWKSYEVYASEMWNVIKDKTVIVRT